MAGCQANPAPHTPARNSACLISGCRHSPAAITTGKSPFRAVTPYVIASPTPIPSLAAPVGVLLSLNLHSTCPLSPPPRER